MLFAIFFVFRPMIPLTFGVAIFNLHTSFARLETGSFLFPALGTAGNDMVHPRTMIQYSMLRFAL
jgi:hypothetical protein